MCRFRAFVTLFIVSLMFLAAFGSISPRRAAAQLPTADLAVVRLTGPNQAKPGRVVRAKVVTTNLGPNASELDAFFTFSAGLEMTGMECDLGISADTPACEYSNVAPGTRLTTLAFFRVLPGAGPTETITVCTNSEGETEDPNPSNDCATTTVGINGG
jgi:hypothetical protein